MTTVDFRPAPRPGRNFNVVTQIADERRVRAMCDDCTGAMVAASEPDAYSFPVVDYVYVFRDRTNAACWFPHAAD